MSKVETKKGPNETTRGKKPPGRPRKDVAPATDDDAGAPKKMLRQKISSSAAKRQMTFIDPRLFADDPNALMMPGDAAAYLGVSHKTLAKWRDSGIGPQYVRLEKRVRYSKRDIMVWVESRKVRSISEEVARKHS